MKSRAAFSAYPKGVSDDMPIPYPPIWELMGGLAQSNMEQVRLVSANMPIFSILWPDIMNPNHSSSSFQAL